MDAKVSRSTHVVNFFKPNIGDKQLERYTVHGTVATQCMARQYIVPASILPAHTRTRCFGFSSSVRLERPSGDGALVLSVCPLEVPAGNYNCIKWDAIFSNFLARIITVFTTFTS